MKKKNKTAVDTSIASISVVPDQKQDDTDIKYKQLQLKINYLTQDNIDLKAKVCDLQIMIRQKDEYLKQIFPEETKNSSAKGSMDLSSLKNTRNIKESVLQNVLEGVYNENQRLYELLEKISKERDEAKSKVNFNSSLFFLVFPFGFLFSICQ